MNQLEYQEQALQVLEADLARCRRKAAEHAAELEGQRDRARDALEQVCDQLTSSRRRNEELARTLTGANRELSDCKSVRDAHAARLHIVERRASLLIQAVLEGTDTEAYQAADDLQRILEGHGSGNASR